MTIKIEKKNVLANRDVTHIYEALRDMKVGESFLQDTKQVCNLRSVLSACKTLIGSHFAVRKEVDEHGDVNYRIGRVK